MNATCYGMLLAILCGEAVNPAYATGIGRSCESAVRVEAAANYAIAVPNAGKAIRRVPPAFFGFNLEWVGFQIGLWDSEKRIVNPAAIELLKPFSGAVYRYPGGGAANSFRWMDSIGSREGRAKRKAVDWLQPVAVEFGLDEYLSFVRTVNGKPWIVLNLYGEREGETDPDALLDSALAWVSYARSRERNGAESVLRWELGNELYMGQRRSWPPEKYVRIASEFGHAISEKHRNTKQVVMLQDWKAQTAYTISDYNRQVMSGLREVSTEYAHHLYYDGPPTRRSVAHRFSVICQTLDDARNTGITTPSIWVTEHGRDIPHPYDGSAAWRKLFPKTADLEAALGVADALTLATQIPEIAGMFIHSLGPVKGPWPMFHADENGRLKPTAVFMTIRLLREGLLPVSLETHLRSANASRYQGGYDLRAAVMTTENRDRYAVWAINRSSEGVVVSVSVADMAHRAVKARHRFISGDTVEANNYAAANGVLVREAEVVLAFDANGLAQIELPPYSISTIGFPSR